MAGRIDNGGCGSGGYTFEVDAYVCSEADGTLRVYWNKFSCDGDYTEVITEANWDGSEVTATFEDNDFCTNSGSPIPSITLNVTLSSPGTVTIDWSAESSSCYGSCNQSGIGGSFDVTIAPGGACSVPDDSGDSNCS